MRVDATGTVVDTFSMPLLSIVPEEDSARFGECMRQVAAWHAELAALSRQAQERTDRASQE